MKIYIQFFYYILIERNKNIGTLYVRDPPRSILLNPEFANPTFNH